jgi:hypothetical protein
MQPAPRPFFPRPLHALALSCLLAAPGLATAGPRPDAYWRVEDVRPGMKGTGRTVMKGVKVETFQAEVLGVLKNTSPGRDLVLCRLSGLDLEKTGVIAGMSGSPVYLDDKLLGAVAYAWAYGKEPIAGITPFCQMHGFVEAYERRDLAEEAEPSRVGLAQPLRLGGKDFDAVTVSQGYDDPGPRAADELWLVPLRTPLAASGFTPHSLSLLRQRTGGMGLVPMQGGAAAANVMEEAKNAELEPGGPLAVSLITGDFDLSGIGTVTHIEGKRVYGWGHPMMGLGSCDFPLQTGYIHTIYPRQTVSFKMGSPLRTVGVINADVSTCIAGWLDRQPDMLPVKMSVALRDGPARTFNVNVARQRTLMPTLVFTALTNSVDMEGELPEELTAEMHVRIELDGHAPIVLHDTFSGFSGGRAPQTLFGPVSAVIQALTTNPYASMRITRIECETKILPGRRTADIEAVELSSDAYAPGDTVKGTVFLRPYKGATRRVPVTLKLPADLPEGSYTLTVCEDLACVRAQLRDNPNLSNPQTAEQVLESVQAQLSARRTNVALRLPTAPSGVAVGGKSLPDLPPSMVHILSNSKRTGAQSMGGAVIARQPTDWVIQGSESVKFTVSKNTKVTRGEGR